MLLVESALYISLIYTYTFDYCSDDYTLLITQNILYELRSFKFSSILQGRRYLIYSFSQQWIEWFKLLHPKWSHSVFPFISMTSIFVSSSADSGHLKDTRILNTGVPHGAVLSLILFQPFINSILKPTSTFYFITFTFLFFSGILLHQSLMTNNYSIPPNYFLN